METAFRHRHRYSLFEILPEKRLRLAGSVTAATFIICLAHAEEGITPFLPGISIGVPIAKPLVPGFYFTNSYGGFSTDTRDGTGSSTRTHTNEINLAYQLQWAAPSSILGATFSAFFDQPFRYAATTQSGASTNKFSPLNVVISPANLSWSLGHDVFVLAGFTIYPGFSGHNPYTPTGRDYATIEPNVGLTWQTSIWNLTVHPVIDINAQNQTTSYRSGSIVLMDYTATCHVGTIELGLGGTVVDQLEDDRRHGIAVPALPGVNGPGNRARSISLGPTIAYDFGKISVEVYALRDLYAENTAGGTRAWLQIALPLGR